MQVNANAEIVCGIEQLPIRETKTDGPFLPGIGQPLLFRRYYHRPEGILSRVNEQLALHKIDFRVGWLPVSIDAEVRQNLKCAADKIQAVQLKSPLFKLTTEEF